jgi:hypothetical protein
MSITLVASGLSFDMVCSECGHEFKKNLPTVRAAYFHAGLAVGHSLVCPGHKEVPAAEQTSGFSCRSDALVHPVAASIVRRGRGRGRTGT